MNSPISPTYSSFSVPSPFSSASSASFPNENSPTSESQFENLPSPIDTLNNGVAVYSSGPVSVRMLAPQGDIAATYGSDFDYGMMVLGPDLKKTQQLTLLRSHDGSFAKAMDTVYVQQPVPPQRHNQATPPAIQQAQSHHIHAQQSLGPPPITANDVMFDVDLDDWNSSPAALNVNPHSQSITSYPSMAIDAQSTSRPKQGDLIFEGAMARYPTPPNSGHHPSSHNEVNNHFFDLSSPIATPPNADPISASQVCSAPRQYQHHQSSGPTFYSPSHHLSRSPFNHQGHYTVHPAEISPLDSCPSNSPLSVYPEMAAAAGMGCDPGGYLCASDMASADDLKGTLVADVGMGMSVTPSAVQDGWNHERKAVDGDFGDLDAEGEDVDPSDVEQSLGSGPLAGSPLTSVKQDGGENELDDTDESKISEDSATDSDGSEFIPGSRPRLQRRTQTTMSFSYPSYGYAEARSTRTRSGTRYTPYPNDYSNGDGASYVGESSQLRSKRYSDPTSLPESPTEFSDGYLNITTLTTASVTASRRRPRPTNSLPVPIPIPHLTKKSRGRRVPTVSSLEDLRSASSGAGRKRQTVGRGARMYLCEVDGCGKCFARGEHLKRHVRSIHTYEKPHRCPYPGCGKDFSRHDNLGQHMRVHKDYVPNTEA